MYLKLKKKHFTNLDEQNIHTLEDFGHLEPSFSLENYGSRNAAFTSYRGQTNFLTTASPIALYINDIPINYVFTYLIHDFYDIGKMRMMPGPQGFESGLGASAGIINLSLATPSAPKPQTTIKTNIGNYNEKGLSLHTSIPLEEGYLQLNALKSTRDGFTQNIHTGKDVDYQNTEGLSLVYNKRLNDALALTFTAIYDNNDDGGTPYHNNPDTPFEMDQTFEGSVKQTQKLASLKLEYFHDNYLLSSITSFQDFKSSEYLDLDRTPENFIVFDSDEKLRQISQDFRLKYENEESTLTTGLFTSKQLTSTYDETYAYNYLDVQGLGYFRTNRPETQMAMYLSYQQQLASLWKLTTALRYQVTKQKFDNYISYYFPIEIEEYDFISTPGFSLNDTLTWHRLLPKVSLFLPVRSTNKYVCGVCQRI